MVKPTAPNDKITYTLMNMEEIEVTANSVNAFISEECDDEEDHGIDMTIFYYAQQRQCGKLVTKCDGKCSHQQPGTSTGRVIRSFRQESS